jgi:hypothetical protein
MPLQPADEAALTAWWCLHQPQLQHAAEADGWRSVFDTVVTHIRSGRPVSEALAAHQLPIDTAAAVADYYGTVGYASRGELTDLSQLGVEQVDVVGDYRCPLTEHSCPRHAGAHPDTGREPVCAISNTPMRYQPV